MIFMKKIYSIFAMAAMCTAVYAQSSVASRQFAENQKPTAKFSLNNLPKLSELKKANHLQKRAAQKRIGTPTVKTPIYDQPAGKLHSETYRLSYGIYYDANFGHWLTDVDGQKASWVEGDDGKVYLKNPFSTYPTNTWLTATRGQGDTLNVDLPQAIYYEKYTDFFGNPAELTAYAVRMKYAGNSGIYDNDCQRIQYVLRGDSLIKVDEDYSLIGLCGDYGDWYGYADWKTAIGPMTDKIVTPESVETAQPYTIEYDYHDSYMETDERLRYPCKVLFDGDDVYINGLSKNPTDGWAKGTLNKDGQFVFKGQQYIGYDKKNGRYIYFEPIYYKEYTNEDGTTGDSIYVADEIAFTFNADDQTFRSDKILSTNYGHYTITTDKEYPNAYFSFWDQQISAPKDPVFTELYDYNPDDYGTGNFTFRLSNYSEDGYYLNEANCYYNVFLDGEKYTYKADEYQNLPYDITDIPYTFTDKWNIFIFGTQRNLYFNGADWKTVGVQCFYRDEDGNEYRSHRVTAKLKKDETGIEIVTDDADGSATYFDLSGRTVNKPTHGVYLKTVTGKDGSRHTTKMVVK